MKHCFFLILFLCASLTVPAQQRLSMYGDHVKADVKLRYVYSFEEALRLAREQRKPIFFHAFADWAIPCHAMNKQVFSDADFCDYMNRTFINLFADVTDREKPEAVALGKRYNIKTFAHYLILDDKGDVLLRIVGGQPLPQFRHSVELALSPRTSLAGTEAVYKSGKATKKQLAAYLNALALADEDSLYKQVAADYLALLSEKEFAKKENWKAFTSGITDYTSARYRYIVAHKAAFVAENGEEKVNAFLEKFYSEIFEQAVGSKPYHPERLMDMYLSMQKAALPDSSLTFIMYPIAKLRGEKKYDELIDYLTTHSAKLGYVKTVTELSLDLPEITPAQREKVIAYLRNSAASESKENAQQLNELADRLSNDEGVDFEPIAFTAALQKAKAEQKLVFLDCFTSWCGPCKMMTRDVFPQPQVGKVFRERFVSIKIDMEKGEGVELARRYDITAYPTLLILTPEGAVVKKIVGARRPNELIQEVTTLES